MNLNNKTAEELTATVTILIEGKTFNLNRQYATGRELKGLGGLSPDSELYLATSEPWHDQLIANDEKVNLARPGLEQFFVKRKLKYSINGVEFETSKQYISQKEIKHQAKIPPSHQVFLAIGGGYEDELLREDCLINLARPGKEKFYSIAPDVCFDIIVEMKPVKWKKEKICFEDLIKLEYGSIEPGVTYTVSYEDGPRQNKEGSLVAGQCALVQDKMIFHVSKCHKS